MKPPGEPDIAIYISGNTTKKDTYVQDIMYLDLIMACNRHGIEEDRLLAVARSANGLASKGTDGMGDVHLAYNQMNRLASKKDYPPKSKHMHRGPLERTMVIQEPPCRFYVCFWEGNYPNVSRFKQMGQPDRLRWHLLASETATQKRFAIAAWWFGFGLVVQEAFLIYRGPGVQIPKSSIQTTNQGLPDVLQERSKTKKTAQALP